MGKIKLDIKKAVGQTSLTNNPSAYTNKREIWKNRPEGFESFIYRRTNHESSTRMDLRSRKILEYLETIGPSTVERIAGLMNLSNKVIYAELEHLSVFRLTRRAD